MNIVFTFMAVTAGTRCGAIAGRGEDQAILALACGGFGALLLLLIASALREAAAMRRWPVAKGRVLSSSVEQYRALGGAGNFGASRPRMTLYRAKVVYEYDVDGRRFRGERIAQSPGMDRGAPVFAEKTVQRYPVGSAVAVHYHPGRHGEAVLEPRVPAGWIVVLLIAVALLVLAVYVYFGGA